MSAHQEDRCVELKGVDTGKGTVATVRAVIPAKPESARVIQFEQVSESGRRTVTDVHLLAEVLPGRS